MTQRHTFTSDRDARWGGARRPIGCGGFRVLALMTFVFCFVFSCTVNLLNVEVGGKSVARVPLRLNAMAEPTSQPVDDETMQPAREPDALDYVKWSLLR